MNERDDIELLLARVEEMRQAQRQYFANRTEVDKKLSMALESKVDELLKHMRRKGYDPERFKKLPEQKRIF